MKLRLSSRGLDRARGRRSGRGRRRGHGARAAIVAAPAAALTAFLAVACWQPSFDPELTASAVTASKMTLVSTITIAGMREYVSSPGVFLPRRVAAPTDGVWLVGTGADGYEFESTNAWYLSASSTAALFDDWSNAVHFAANPSGWPIARVSPALQETDLLEIITAAASYGTWTAATIYQRPDKPVAMAADTASLENPTEPSLPWYGRLVGAGMTVESAISDTMCLVYFDPSGAGLWVGELPVPFMLPATFTLQPLTMPTGFDASSIRGVGFAARKGDDYYLSVTDDDGAARTWRWASGLAAAPAELAGVAAPLIAVLRDGTLLSGDGMTMTAHEADGAAQFSFPSGSLRFAHERYDYVNEIWQTVFTRTLFTRYQHDDKGEFRAETFEIPSSDLSALAP